jgi:selenide,water dikinase
MGATPILGLAIAAFPTDVLPLEVLQEILRGGSEKAAEAGFPIAGGHTIIDDVPKYGLAVTGVVSVSKLVRNSTAKPGDALILTKPVGNGILISAYRGLSRKRFGKRTAPSLDEAIHWMTMLNRDAATAMIEVGVSAATDVTGYGLIGHLLEMCTGSEVGAEIRASAVPVLPNARDYLARGFRPTGTLRNVETFRKRVEVRVPESEFTLLCDAQTSGGLLIAVSSEKLAALQARLQQSGLFYATIGTMTDQSGKLTLIP